MVRNQPLVLGQALTMPGSFLQAFRLVSTSPLLQLHGEVVPVNGLLFCVQSGLEWEVVS